MNAPEHPAPDFTALGLPGTLLKALDAVGYETPSPIQAQTIPVLLDGQDVLGHAPTGTGKTAAFALPLIASLLNTDPASNKPGTLSRDPGVRVLVLVPTRELAIQVAEAFRRYATGIDGFRVLPIYGGQDIGGQRAQLKRGVQVVVGTPGRVMDHMRRGTLPLDKLTSLVLDEADEMLRMGFIDDVQWVLEQLPEKRQMALFSATMPKPIRAIAKRHMQTPAEISVRGKATTADTIRQRFWLVSGVQKLDALTRLLEVEEFDAVLVFVRTRLATAELAERLQARGHSAAALNGDMAQKQREQMVEGLKRGKLDVLVATDVAARGLDVERISHVINFDIPYDSEAYVHRIGRTGRAGRNGDAVLFVTQREKRMLHVIEKATGQRITPYELPSNDVVNQRRIADFKQRITDTLAGGDITFMQTLVSQYQKEHDVPAEDVAAALARMVIGDRPFLLSDSRPVGRRERPAKAARTPDAEPRKARQRPDAAPHKKPASNAPSAPLAKSTHSPSTASAASRSPTSGPTSKPGAESSSKAHAAPAARTPADALEMERFKVAVGDAHGVKAANLVGAIASEAGIDAMYIGRIDIREDHSFVELPSGMPKAIYKDLRKAWVCGQRLMIKPAAASLPPNPQPPSGTAKSQTGTATVGVGKSGSGKDRSGKPGSGRAGSHRTGSGKTQASSKPVAGKPRSQAARSGDGVKKTRVNKPRSGKPKAGKRDKAQDKAQDKA